VSCDIAQFYSEKRVIAKKQHKCCETGKPIQPDEAYWRCTGKWDGEVQSFAQSEAAYHFARYLNGIKDQTTGSQLSMRDAYSEDCIPFGHVRYELSECCEEDASLRDEWERVKRGEITRNTTLLEA